MKTCNVLAINGSPRKNGNSIALLHSAMEGARVAGGAVTLLHLADYRYQGCISCFRCRRRSEPCQGCGFDDPLQTVLRACYEADVLLLACPIYFANYPSGIRACMERLLYHYPHQPGTGTTLKPMRLFYSMNATRQQAESLHYPIVLGANEDFFRRNFVDVESVWVYNTWQFENYDEYIHSVNLSEKRRARLEEFPSALEQARQAGAGAVTRWLAEDP